MNSGWIYLQWLSAETSLFYTATSSIPVWTPVINPIIALSDRSITSIKIALGAIGSDNIAVNSIYTEALSARVVDTTKLGLNAVNSQNIAVNSIVTAHLTAGAVTSDIIAANAIIAGHISANAVTTTALSSGVVTSDKIVANAITSVKIAANSIIAQHLTTGAVVITETAQIQDAIITNAKIGDLSANKITAGTINAMNITVNSLNAGLINVGTLVKTRGGTGLTSSFMATGTYQGTGEATLSVTNLGFQPKYLMVWRDVVGQNAGNGPFTKITQDGVNSMHNTDDGIGPYYGADILISLDADGFTVGDGTGTPRGGANNSGNTYTWLSWVF